MRVLWVSVSPIGPIGKLVNISSYQGTSGGWIQSEYESLMGENVELGFLTTSASIKKGQIKEFSGDIGEAYCINAPKISCGKKPSKSMIKCVKEVITRFKPDLIQIWGTETTLTYTASVCYPEIPKLIFIQGLIGIHIRHKKKCFYESDVDTFKWHRLDLKKNIKQWIRDVMFERQAVFEKQALIHGKNVILDSTFSEAYCMAVNENINCYKYYLHPNKGYYDAKWSIHESEPYTIFTVAGNSKIKGIHQLLRAILLVRNKYPNVKIIVPGNFCIKKEVGKITVTSKNATIYEHWLVKFITTHHLENNIEFVGKQNINGMVCCLKQSRVFINPSNMEVHALSLREAMAMGVPCISTVCGSVNEYVEHGKTGLLYRYEEFEVLAHYITKIFGDSDFTQSLGENAYRVWREKINKSTLYSIYENILKNSDKE